MLYQREADKLWKKNYHLSRNEIGKKIAKEINRLIGLAEKEIYEESNPLNEIAILLSDNHLKANPDTIRRNIKKPLKKIRL